MAAINGIDGGTPFDNWGALDNPTQQNQPATLTCQVIAADVRAKFGDDAGVQLSDSDIIRWINNGARRLA